MQNALIGLPLRDWPMVYFCGWSAAPACALSGVQRSAVAAAPRAAAPVRLAFGQELAAVDLIHADQYRHVQRPTVDPTSLIRR